MSVGKEEEQEVVENDKEGSESESSYDSDDNDSSFDSEMEDEANKLLDALRQENEALRKVVGQVVKTKTPVEVWDEFIEGVETCTNASIKVADEMVAWVAKTPVDSEERSALTDKLANDLVRASQAGFVVIHSILGRVFLSLLSPNQQEQVFQAILSKHAKTITYWKLGSDDSTAACGIPTTALLKAMSSVDWPNLTELEMRGLELKTKDQVGLLLAFLKRSPKIRQFNGLGLVMSEALVATSGLFDPIVAYVQTIQGFDELQLCRVVENDKTAAQDPAAVMPSLISAGALENLLSVKVKWWRMSLDGMAFTDRHVEIIGAALKASDTCKMNDLLSLQHNPQVTAQGWHSLYSVCLCKQRMGLVLSDDPSWVAKFDMVRPLNNLHRRLEYIELDTVSGRYKYRSREAWIEFLSVVGNLNWVGDCRQVNYLWFALLEQPELIHE